MESTPSLPPAPASAATPPAGGGPPLSPTRAVAGGWRAFLADPWTSLGVFLVLGAVLVVGQIIPFFNLLFGLLVAPALYAGGAWFFVRGIRNENPPFESAFEGFQRWPSVTGAVILVFGVSLLVMVPMFVLMFGTFGFMALMSGHVKNLEGVSRAAVVPLAVAMAITYPVLVWWSSRSYFSLFTVMEPDRPGALEAVRRSFALTRGSVWRVVGLWLLSIPVVLLGCLALCVGVVPALLVVYYAIAHAYEQLRARAR
jgi:uncharacterized membrane protein